MKEDIFNDKKASASEDEDNSDDASASEWQTDSIKVNGEPQARNDAIEDMSEIVDNIIDDAFTIIESKAPKTVTSMYGKVYKLKIQGNSAHAQLNVANTSTHYVLLFIRLSTF